MNKINIVILLFFSLIVLSCDSSTIANINVYTTNETGNDFKIKVVSLAKNDSCEYIDVPSKANKQKIWNYTTIEGTGYAGVKRIKIYLYNCVDSTSIVLDNYQDIENYQKFVSETSHMKYGDVEYDIDVNVNISNDMLILMSKNTFTIR